MLLVIIVIVIIDRIPFHSNILLRMKRFEIKILIFLLIINLYEIEFFIFCISVNNSWFKNIQLTWKQ